MNTTIANFRHNSTRIQYNTPTNRERNTTYAGSMLNTRSRHSARRAVNRTRSTPSTPVGAAAAAVTECSAASSVLSVDAARVELVDLVAETRAGALARSDDACTGRVPNPSRGPPLTPKPRPTRGLGLVVPAGSVGGCTSRPSCPAVATRVETGVPVVPACVVVIVLANLVSIDDAVEVDPDNEPVAAPLRGLPSPSALAAALASASAPESVSAARVLAFGRYVGAGRRGADANRVAGGRDDGVAAGGVPSRGAARAWLRRRVAGSTTGDERVRARVDTTAPGDSNVTRADDCCDSAGDRGNAEEEIDTGACTGDGEPARARGIWEGDASVGVCVGAEEDGAVAVVVAATAGDDLRAEKEAAES